MSITGHHPHLPLHLTLQVLINRNPPRELIRVSRQDPGVIDKTAAARRVAEDPLRAGIRPEEQDIIRMRESRTHPRGGQTDLDKAGIATMKIVRGLEIMRRPFLMENATFIMIDIVDSKLATMPVVRDTLSRETPITITLRLDSALPGGLLVAPAQDKAEGTLEGDQGKEDPFNLVNSILTSNDIALERDVPFCNMNTLKHTENRSGSS